MKHRAAFILTIALALCLPVAAQQSGETDCTSCHDQGQKVAKSAHASVGCAKCHERHEQYPHPANIPKPVCGNCHTAQGGEYASGVHGQAAKKGNAGAPDCSMCHGAAHETVSTKTGEFHKNVPDTCGMCHSEISEQFKASVHGKAVARGVVDAPVCTDCHGEHSILSPKNAASSVSSGHIRDTCARCHADVQLARRFGLPPDRITSFDASFHGLAAKSGSQTVANCASCHGFHNILPSSDEKSSTNPKNLPKTCGTCHPGAGTRFALGKVHWVEGQSESRTIHWIRWAYLILIPLTIGYMILHHGGDWVRKLWRLRIKPVAMGPIYPALNFEIRMYPIERVQHFLLLVSFITLAWSGFALKYPDQFWARPLVLREGVYPLRGLIHRTAAVVMTLTGLMHVICLIFNKKLREHWLEMIPVVRDAQDAVAVLFYNLGLTKKKPIVAAHGYVEKMEYWAVVWGTFVMGLTGFILWANNWTLRLIPKEWIDAATSVHFYEAVLASLAIVVWHFYTVVFDPDVYPMDTAWLTGKSVRRRESHQAHAQEPKPEFSESKGD